MKKYNLLAVILLGAALLGSCDKKISFNFDTTGLKEQYQPQEAVALGVQNPDNATIDSIVYYINDKKVGTAKGAEKLNFELKDQKLGYQNLKALVYTDGKNQEALARIELVSGVQPKLLNYTIVNTYPHDITSYTQGLEFYRDTLYEGTGQRGSSKLLKTDYKTGKAYKSISLEDKYFGEGITILKNKVYQLTWQENVAFVYNADTFVKEKTFNYFKNIEGWGLANDGTNLYQSDGTEKIWVVNPADYKEIDYINVYTSGSKIKDVNELEWIEGKLYGNIYQKDAVAVINPKNGAVEAIINLAELKKKIVNPNLDPSNDVLNGIAYNPKTKTIFVTGKKWDKMFEIKITE